VYEAEPMTVWNGKRKLFLGEPAPKGATPELYLIRIGSDEIGWIDRHSPWICDDGEVVSFSEGNDQQEALVILPAYGWVNSSDGSLFLLPEPERPASARLQKR
jgi:hypothetical protein